MGDKKNGGFFEAIGNMVDYKTIASTGQLQTTVNGNREVIIDGGKGILEYDNENVCVNAGTMQIKVFGTDLEIKCFSERSIIIVGTVRSVEYLD